MLDQRRKRWPNIKPSMFLVCWCAFRQFSSYRCCERSLDVNSVLLVFYRPGWQRANLRQGIEQAVPYNFWIVPVVFDSNYAVTTTRQFDVERQLLYSQNVLICTE